MLRQPATITAIRSRIRNGFKAPAIAAEFGLPICDIREIEADYKDRRAPSSLLVMQDHARREMKKAKKRGPQAVAVVKANWLDVMPQWVS